MIDEKLYVGTYPQDPNDVKTLRELGISAILNLQSDEDLYHRAVNWEAMFNVIIRSGMAVERVPIYDLAKRDLLKHLSAAVEALERLLSEGHTVYLHCNAGVNRSPTVAIAYYVVHGQMELDEATKLVESRRRCIPYVDVVETWLRKRSKGK